MIFKVKQLGTWNTYLFSFIVQLFKISGIFYTFVPSKKSRFYQDCVLPLKLVFLVFVRNSELSAALCSSSCKNFATTFCSHAGTEPEFSIAFYFTWLICSFHRTLLLYIKKCFRFKNPSEKSLRKIVL